MQCLLMHTQARTHFSLHHALHAQGDSVSGPLKSPLMGTIVLSKPPSSSGKASSTDGMSTSVQLPSSETYSRSAFQVSASTLDLLWAETVSQQDRTSKQDSLKEFGDWTSMGTARNNSEGLDQSQEDVASNLDISGGTHKGAAPIRKPITRGLSAAQLKFREKGREFREKGRLKSCASFSQVSRISEVSSEAPAPGTSEQTRPAVSLLPPQGRAWEVLCCPQSLHLFSLICESRV